MLIHKAATANLTTIFINTNTVENITDITTNPTKNNINFDKSLQVPIIADSIPKTTRIPIRVIIIIPPLNYYIFILLLLPYNLQLK